MTPSNSILYCSQACRRKDDAKPLSASILPPVDARRSTPGFHGRSRSNSPKPSFKSPPVSPTPTIRIPPDNHTHKADLDPTEWKPKLRGSHARASEAYSYLAKFHARMNQESEFEPTRVERPGHKFSASMYNIPTLTPSLDSTATTAASSFDSFDYDFNTRPLQARQNPMYALSTCIRSDDLVTPHVPPPPVPLGEPLSTNDALWEKKVVMKRVGAEHEGLGKLIQGKAV